MIWKIAHLLAYATILATYCATFNGEAYAAVAAYCVLVVVAIGDCLRHRAHKVRQTGEELPRDLFDEVRKELRLIAAEVAELRVEVAMIAVGRDGGES